MQRIGCSSFTRCLLAVSFLLWLAACHKWVPVEGSPAAALRELADRVEPEQEKVRLHLAQDATLEGWVSGIVGDTVLIRSRKVNAERNAAIPLTRIARLDVKESKPTATLALELGIVAVALAAVVFIAFAIAVSEPGY